MNEYLERGVPGALAFQNAIAREEGRLHWPRLRHLQSRPVSPAVRALRGATTVDEDTPEQIRERVVALLQAMIERNDIDHEDLISIIFTATPDIHSAFPPAAARTMGLGDVPLLGASELDVEGGVQRCIRVMMHLTTDRSRTELRHVYLEGASHLRDDLPS